MRSAVDVSRVAQVMVTRRKMGVEFLQERSLSCRVKHGVVAGVDEEFKFWMEMTH